MNEGEGECDGGRRGGGVVRGGWKGDVRLVGEGWGTRFRRVWEFGGLEGVLGWLAAVGSVRVYVFDVCGRRKDDSVG